MEQHTPEKELYEKELAVLETFRGLLAMPPDTPIDWQSHVLELFRAYDKLLTDTMKLSRMSDRQYTRLREATTRLSQTNTQLQKLSSTDMLTGLLNRYSMDEVLRGFLSYLNSNNGQASLLMIDVDHFKDINDTWGHGAGDAALVRLASHLAARIRSSDFAARWGGDEFLVLLPHSNLDNARMVAETIRGSLEAEASVRRPCCTLSIGVAAWKQGFTLEDWLALTDRCLYQAKTLGRNRVSIPSDLQESP